VLIRGGIDPSESDPHFHQQMVYAVVSETVKRFEFALGRPIKWRRPPAGMKQDDPHRRRLRVLPHGLQEANAFYDPARRALVFGYFQADLANDGFNLPGQTVFTCLSHDIIAHETTHALIDGLRENFMLPTHIDTPAFHEGFADIVALFQHFSFEEVLVDAIQRTGGYLQRRELGSDAPPDGNPVIQAERGESNPLVELAKQFGEAIGNRKALRSAIDTAPDPSKMATVTEPHSRGAILVAAVFDAYFSVYIRQTRQLMRVARNGGPAPLQGELHPDLASLLARQASKIAENFVNICIRALDYCPPVDIRFGEFLRAVITADMDMVPDDPVDYRASLIEGFRARGVVPEDVSSYSEESLKWQPPETGPRGKSVPKCTGLKFDILDELSKADSKRNAVLLHKFATSNARSLRLDPTVPVQVHSFHPIVRVGPDGQLRFHYVAELLQRKDAPVDPKDPKSATFTFYGGATLVINRDGTLCYAIVKRLDNKRRLEAEQAYHQTMGLESAMAPYAASAKRLAPVTPRIIHRGY
jgi:hypothetical protein